MNTKIGDFVAAMCWNQQSRIDDQRDINKNISAIIVKIIIERTMNMAEFKYEITKEIGVLSQTASGWRKELNLVSWNGGKPKFDLREWAPEHEKMGKGVTLTTEEAKN